MEVNENISFEEKFEGSTVTVKFLVNRNIRFSHKGKHWPIATQCVITYNNKIIGLGEVVKHELDKHNPRQARIFSAKKAFEQTKLWKEIRTRLWNKILKA